MLLSIRCTTWAVSWHTSHGLHKNRRLKYISRYIRFSTYCISITTPKDGMHVHMDRGSAYMSRRDLLLYKLREELMFDLRICYIDELDAMLCTKPARFCCTTDVVKFVCTAATNQATWTQWCENVTYSSQHAHTDSRLLCLPTAA